MDETGLSLALLETSKNVFVATRPIYLEAWLRGYKTGSEVIKLIFSYSTQLSKNFILLINVKMPTIVGILTFISMINTTSV